MGLTSRYTLLLGATLLTYLGVSKVIFEKVYNTSHTIVDELYHIPQGLTCCGGDMTKWDPKITTLPGLYYVSALLVGPLFTCNIYNLRLVNLASSCANLLLLASILSYIYGTNNESQPKIILQALNLTILPPLYFFAHVYYTDVMSLTFLLAFSRMTLVQGTRWSVFFLGVFSVLMRQTNVVFIALVFGHKVLDILIRSSRVFGNSYLSFTPKNRRSLIAGNTDPTKLKRYYDLNDLFIALRYHNATYFLGVVRFIAYDDFMLMLQQFLVIGSFGVFVGINKSIVVGDKEAHKVTIHLAQLLYFLLFYGVFGLPYVLLKLRSTLKLMWTNKRNIFLFTGLFFLIVHYNTIVHPYLLSDNRHYTFYVWNRWFSKGNAIYYTIPVYVGLLFSLYDNLKDQNCISFLFPYTISLILVLGLQSLLEIRYFLIPYLIIRLRFMKPPFKVVIFEFLWYLLLNALMLNVFFTKEIYWTDFADPQRLIW